MSDGALTGKKEGRKERKEEGYFFSSIYYVSCSISGILDIIAIIRKTMPRGFDSSRLRVQVKFRHLPYTFPPTCRKAMAAARESVINKTLVA